MVRNAISSRRSALIKVNKISSHFTLRVTRVKKYLADFHFPASPRSSKYNNNSVQSFRGKKRDKYAKLFLDIFSFPPTMQKFPLLRYYLYHKSSRSSEVIYEIVVRVQFPHGDINAESSYFPTALLCFFFAGILFSRPIILPLTQISQHEIRRGHAEGKRKGEYRNRVTVAVFCNCERQELRAYSGLEKLGGPSFTSFERAARETRMRNIEEDTPFEIKAKSCAQPRYAREVARPLARQYIAMRRKSK